MICFLVDSHLPPGNARHLHALVGPSMAFVFLVSLISFLVHHWCPDAKGKSQEVEPSVIWAKWGGEGTVYRFVLKAGARHRAVFLSSLPPFLLYLATSSLRCSTRELGCITRDLSS